MLRPTVVPLVLALICLIAPPCPGQDGWIDDFDTADLWTGINSRAPAEVHAENGILTIIDPPGGKVTWGTSVSASLPPIDLDKYPYLVVKLVEVTHTFRVTLVNRDKSEKVGGLCTATKPGIIVLDVRNTLGWKGKTNLSLGLYASGTESRVKLDCVKFTGTLSPQEAKAYERWKAMQPKRPKPFHGMEELAARRGWVHEPYFRVDPTTDAKADEPWIEDFDSAKAWFANNPKTPPAFSAENGILTLKDPPGGDVTWGTSLYTRVPSVNLTQNPYLVAKVLDLSSAFRITVINQTTAQKIGGLCATEKPAIAIVNLAERLGWRGVTPLHVGLYTGGTESWAKVDYVKITGTLTPKEQAAYEAQRPTQTAKARQFSRPDSRPFTNPVFQAGIRYLSERLVYRDSVTGNPVWRMTNYPDTDCVVYYDFMHWNADGTLIRWNSQRGGAGQWLMDADGTNVRAFELPSGTRGYSANWSIHDPNILFYSSSGPDRSAWGTAATNRPIWAPSAARSRWKTSWRTSKAA